MQSDTTILAFKEVMWQKYFNGFYPNLKLTGADTENMTTIQPLDPKRASEDGKSMTVVKQRNVSVWAQDT